MGNNSNICRTNREINKNNNITNHASIDHSADFTKTTSFRTGQVTDPRPDWYPSFLQLQHGTNCGGVLHLLARQLLAKERLHHFATTCRQDRQQAVTQTVGLLIAALKPHTSPCADLSGVHLNPVVPAGDPLLQVRGPQVLDIA